MENGETNSDEWVGPQCSHRGRDTKLGKAGGGPVLEETPGEVRAEPGCYLRQETHSLCKGPGWHRSRDLREAKSAEQE